MTTEASNPASHGADRLGWPEAPNLPDETGGLLSSLGLNKPAGTWRVPGNPMNGDHRTDHFHGVPEVT